MKTSLKLLALMLAIAALPITACNNDDDDDGGNDDSPIGRLTGTNCWRVTKIVSTNPLTGMDEELDIEDCDKDDCIQFETNGTASFDEGATKCDPNDPQTESGMWAFSGNNTMLTLTDSQDTITFNIDELTSSQMVLSIEEQILGFNIKVATTYQAN